MELNQLKHIAVEGPIGVGKSSLAQILSQDLKTQLVLERADENPFLPQFYGDPARFAFQTQVFFLLSRYRQLMDLKQQNLFEQKVVCDYIFGKDLIFAHINLTQEEMGLYTQIFQLLDQRLPKPDAVIFMQASTEVLMKRIKKRDIDYEKAIQSEYMLKLSQAYSQFFMQYNACPVLVVNTSGLNFVESPEDYEMLKKELIHLIKTGQEKHYVTIDSR
jgi:deoxyadenosine/deoxycytidine kinase